MEVIRPQQLIRIREKCRFLMVGTRAGSGCGWLGWVGLSWVGLSWVGLDSGDNETNKRTEVDGGDKATTVNQNKREVSIPDGGNESRIGLRLARLGWVELGWAELGWIGFG